jgi:hypothetical protein
VKWSIKPVFEKPAFEVDPGSPVEQEIGSSSKALPSCVTEVLKTYLMESSIPTWESIALSRARLQLCRKWLNINAGFSPATVSNCCLLAEETFPAACKTQPHDC